MASSDTHNQHTAAQTPSHHADTPSHLLILLDIDELKTGVRYPIGEKGRAHLTVTTQGQGGSQQTVFTFSSPRSFNDGADTPSSRPVDIPLDTITIGQPASPIALRKLAKALSAGIHPPENGDEGTDNLPLPAYAVAQYRTFLAQEQAETELASRPKQKNPSLKTPLTVEVEGEDSFKQYTLPDGASYGMTQIAEGVVLMRNEHDQLSFMQHAVSGEPASSSWNRLGKPVAATALLTGKELEIFSTQHKDTSDVELLRYLTAGLLNAQDEKDKQAIEGLTGDIAAISPQAVANETAYSLISFLNADRYDILPATKEDTVLQAEKAAAQAYSPRRREDASPIEFAMDGERLYAVTFAEGRTSQWLTFEQGKWVTAAMPEKDVMEKALIRTDDGKRTQEFITAFLNQAGLSASTRYDRGTTYFDILFDPARMSEDAAQDPAFDKKGRGESKIVLDRKLTNIWHISPEIKQAPSFSSSEIPEVRSTVSGEVNNRVEFKADTASVDLVRTITIGMAGVAGILGLTSIINNVTNQGRKNPPDAGAASGRPGQEQERQERSWTQYIAPVAVLTGAAAVVALALRGNTGNSRSV